MRYFYCDIFSDAQMKRFKEDIDSTIYHMTNDIVNKEKSALDNFITNMDELVSYSHICKRKRNFNKDILQ